MIVTVLKAIFLQFLQVLFLELAVTNSIELFLWTRGSQGDSGSRLAISLPTQSAGCIHLKILCMFLMVMYIWKCVCYSYVMWENKGRRGCKHNRHEEIWALNETLESAVTPSGLTKETNQGTWVFSLKGGYMHSKGPQAWQLLLFWSINVIICQSCIQLYVQSWGRYWCQRVL